MKEEHITGNVKILPGIYEVINFDGYYWGHSGINHEVKVVETGILMQYIDYPCDDYNVLLEVDEPDEYPRYVIIMVPAKFLTYLTDTTLQEQ